MVAVTGLKQVLAAFERESEKMKEATAAAIYQKGLAIIGLAKKYTPVDVGRLRASGYASPPKSSDNPKVELGFGADYALPVHERVEVFHAVGQPLYLKRAVDEHTSGYAQWISRQARSNYRRGVKYRAVSAQGVPKTRTAGRASAKRAGSK